MCVCVNDSGSTEDVCTACGPADNAFNAMATHLSMHLNLRRPPGLQQLIPSVHQTIRTEYHAAVQVCPVLDLFYSFQHTHHMKRLKDHCCIISKNVKPIHFVMLAYSPANKFPSHC